MTQSRASSRTTFAGMPELFGSRRVVEALPNEREESPRLSLLSVDAAARSARFRVSATSGGKAVTVFARQVGNPITLKDVGAPRLIARGKIRDGVFDFVWSKPEDTPFAYVYAIEMNRERKLKRSAGVMLKG